MAGAKTDNPPAKKRRGRPPKVKADDVPLEALDGLDTAAPPLVDPTPTEPAPPKDAPPGSVGDGEPKRVRAPRARVTKKGTQQIEDALAEILQIPAVPAAVFGDTWMAEHFTVQGRALANRIATVSERNPVLRAWCEKALEGESVAVLLMAGVMYAAPPLMHFGVIPGAEMLGVPKIGETLRAQAPDWSPTEQWKENMAEEVPARQWGGDPVEGEPPTGPPPVDTDTVDVSVHFAGGDEEDTGPPVFMEQMIGG